MNAQTWVALGASFLAAVVAVTVPLVSFRTTLRLDRVRWLRDERAKLYVDLIVEAVAEYEVFRVVVPDPKRVGEYFSSARERAALGARVAAFASDRVRDAWMRYDEEINEHRPADKLSDEKRRDAQRLIYEKFADLEVSVREELGAAGAQLPVKSSTR